MNDLPVSPLSPEAQQRMMGQMYGLMGKQVKSYHKHHHLGEHSSVSTELAQELMESVVYTVDLVGGVYASEDLEEALRHGQQILEEKCRKASSMLELVRATAPRWQTECRWDAIQYLGAYLACYDLLHLAHKGPEDLFYPILIAQPEGIRGIDVCLFYLQILWIENQIMAGVPEGALGRFWAHLPAAALNPCEYLLINGMGKALLKTGLDPLLMTEEEQLPILAAMMGATEETLNTAAKRLCTWLDLKDEAAGMYVQAVIPQLRLWTGSGGCNGIPDNLFL